MRVAEAADVPRIASLFRDSRAAAMPWLPELHSQAEDLEFFGRSVATQAAYVAVLAGSVVGFAVVDRSERELVHLYLDPTVRRRGVGSALLAHARAENPGSLQLWCFAENHHARAFYAAQGADELYGTDGTENEERLPDVRLELPHVPDAAREGTEPQ